MFQTLKNAFKTKEVRNKILMTLLLVAIYRLGSFIPVPGINASVTQSVVGGNTFLGIINASIIIQLLTIVIPSLERLSRQGDEGRKKLTKITRYFTVVLAAVQAVGILFAFKAQGVINTHLFGSGNAAVPEWIVFVFVSIVLIAGASLCMWIGERITAALHAVGMSDFRFATPSRLSGGQKQRIAIAGVLAIRPRIMILDESTAMLDPKGRREVMDVIQKLNKEQGMTVILITHFMEEALEADRAIVMHRGEVVMDGTPEEIFARAEELETYNLTLPRAAYICKCLQEAGMPVGNAFCAEALAEEICRSLQKG